MKIIKFIFLFLSVTFYGQIPNVSISNSQTIIEGGVAAYTVNLSIPSSIDTFVSVIPTVSFGTGGNDFLIIDSFLLIPAGQTSSNFSVSAIDDSIGEPSESFNIGIIVESQNTSNSTSFTTLIILDNDPNIVGEVLAVDDDYFFNSGVAAGGQPVIENDTINGIPVTVNSVVLTPILLPLGIQLSLPFGTLNFQGNEPDGVYIVKYQICAVSDLSNCKTATVTITIGNPLVLKDFNFNNFIISPNPVSSFFEISNNSMIDFIEIFSTLGQKVIAKTINSLNAEIDITTIPSGVYFLKVNSNGFEKTTKFIKA